METKTTVIRLPFIDSLEFKNEDYDKFYGDKANQVSWRVFSNNYGSYSPRSLSFCEKLRLVPYGIIKTMLSVPYHLFIVTVWRPCSNQLDFKNWCWKVAFILAYDIKQGLGLVILPIYEKKGFSWIDESHLEKNRLFYMYDSRTKDKFLASLLNELVVENVEEKKNESSELENTEIDLDKQEIKSVGKDQLSNFIDIVLGTCNKNELIEIGYQRLLNILNYVNEGTCNHPVIFLHLQDMVQKEGIDYLPFPIAITHLKNVIEKKCENWSKESKFQDVLDALNSFLKPVSQLEEAQKKLQEEDKKNRENVNGKNYKETLKIIDENIAQWSRSTKISALKKLGFQHAFQFIEDKLKSHEGNVNFYKDYFLELIIKYEIQNESIYSTYLKSFEKFPEQYLDIHQRLIEIKGRREYEFVCHRYIKNLIKKTEMESKEIEKVIELLNDEETEKEFTELLKKREENKWVEDF